jgi:hypothetical protein
MPQNAILWHSNSGRPPGSARPRPRAQVGLVPSHNSRLTPSVLRVSKPGEYWLEPTCAGAGAAAMTRTRAGSCLPGERQNHTRTKALGRFASRTDGWM